MPTRAQVLETVTATVAGFTRLRPERVTPELELRRPPLSLDNNALAFLAMSLRGYVKRFRPNNTIHARDVRKQGLTVQQLADLVFERAN